MQEMIERHLTAEQRMMRDTMQHAMELHGGIQKYPAGRVSVA